MTNPLIKKTDGILYKICSPITYVDDKIIMSPNFINAQHLFESMVVHDAEDINTLYGVHMTSSFSVPLYTDYLDYVVNGLSITTTESFLFLNELSGTTATDSIGNGNDGTFVNGPTLGEPALANGFNYSILGPGFIEVPHIVGADPATDDVTIRFDFKYPSAIGATNEGLFGKSAAGERFDIYFTTNGVIRFDFYDGVNLARITTVAEYDDNLPHSLSARHNTTTQEIEMWIDGVSVGTASTSAVTLTSDNTRAFRFNYSYTGGATIGWIGGPAIFSSALSDANCIALSQAMP